MALLSKAPYPCNGDVFAEAIPLNPKLANRRETFSKIMSQQCLGNGVGIELLFN